MGPELRNDMEAQYRLDPRDRDGRKIRIDASPAFPSGGLFIEASNAYAFRASDPPAHFISACPVGLGNGPCFLGRDPGSTTTLKTLTTVSEMKDWAREERAHGRSTGLVPTMGFLHEGHLSLIRRARAENDRVVVSIFVNPTQFGPNEDLERYPRDPEGDAEKCRNAGTDVLFVPDMDDVYGPGFQTFVSVDELSRQLCGASRPGHFRGVATVVFKLFSMVLPTRAYFGAKDYQQLCVIRTMVRDLNLDVEIVPCPIVREPDGLAMSSRNAYLSSDERKQAVVLSRALDDAERLFRERETDGARYIEEMTRIIAEAPNGEIDYVDLVNPDNLETLEIVDDRAVAVLAVKIGSTRLIDNRELVRDSDYLSA